MVKDINSLPAWAPSPVPPAPEDIFLSALLYSHLALTPDLEAEAGGTLGMMPLCFGPQFPLRAMHPC